MAISRGNDSAFGYEIATLRSQWQRRAGAITAAEKQRQSMRRPRQYCGEDG